MSATDTHRAIDAVWRIESAKLIGALVRIVRDISLAEELAQDALVAALQQWPTEGIPRNPGAWLMQTAKHRAIDHFRHRQRADRKHEQVAYELETEQERAPDFDTALDDDVGDDVLRLMFTACHPVLSADARVALTLRLIGGLTTEEIARAYLVPEPTIAQRIVRAKKAIARARVPFEVPRGVDRAARLASVLEVIYLVFNEGYSATAGDDWMRPQLCEDAMRLGRVLAGLAPGESEVHGLVALMELQASRIRARVSRTGGADRDLAPTADLTCESRRQGVGHPRYRRLRAFSSMRESRPQATAPMPTRRMKTISAISMAGSWLSRYYQHKSRFS